ncbi:MAG: DUF4387 domain-containing protein [Lautropia sp.]
MTTLADIAWVVRSKNAGPLTLTLDLLFADDASFERALAAPGLSARSVAARYGVAPGLVTRIPYPPARAIKFTMPRAVVAGNPGDRDVYGAQQHAPLLDIEV